MRHSVDAAAQGRERLCRRRRQVRSRAPPARRGARAGHRGLLRARLGRSPLSGTGPRQSSRGRRRCPPQASSGPRWRFRCPASSPESCAGADPRHRLAVGSLPLPLVPSHGRLADHRRPAPVRAVLVASAHGGGPRAHMSPLRRLLAKQGEGPPASLQWHVPAVGAAGAGRRALQPRPPHGNHPFSSAFEGRNRSFLLRNLFP